MRRHRPAVGADPAADRGRLQTIFASEPTEEERARFLSEMAKSPPHARTAIMADYTRHN